MFASIRSRCAYLRSMLADRARCKRTSARGKRTVARCSLTVLDVSERPLEVNEPSLEGSEHPLAAAIILLRFTSIRSRFTSVRSLFASIRSTGAPSTQCSLPSAQCLLPSARRWRPATNHGFFVHRAASNVARQDVWSPAHIRDTSFRGTTTTRTSRDPRVEPTPPSCRPRPARRNVRSRAPKEDRAGRAAPAAEPEEIA